MKTTNIAELKSHLSHYIHLTEKGEEIEICKRNIPIAKLIPFPVKKNNETVLGCGLNSVSVSSDLTEPAFAEDEWNMLKGNDDVFT